jgi:hypothetical protein
MAEAMHKILSRDGLVRYLASAIPCSCLDEMKKGGRGGPKGEYVLLLCKKEDTIVTLLMYSGCKIVEQILLDGVSNCRL